MSRCRTILGCVALSWLLAGGLASPAWCQIRAMPLNTAKEMFPLLEDSEAETLEYEVTPKFEANSDDEDTDSSGVFQRMSYLEDVPAAPDTQADPVIPIIPDIPAPDDATGYLLSPNQAVFSDDDSQPLDMMIQPQQAGIYGRGISGCGIGGDCWTWQAFPDGLIYRSYMAGGRESRFAAHWVHERDQGWLWDITLGGRMGLLRFGTENDAWPEGWQLDIEGAAFPRLSLERTRDMDATDFRFGVPLTFRRGRWEGKFAYYHLSSHLGDEFIEAFGTQRINFVRDTIVLGVAVWAFPDMRLYSEAGWAFRTRGGSAPWEFQFGVDWCSTEPTGRWGGPFFAVNCRIREELRFGGNMTVQNGWQWRGRTGHLMRVGMQYFNGQSDQYQFFTEHEEQIGIGLWYDY